jgi:hypothetical protein
MAKKSKKSTKAKANPFAKKAEDMIAKPAKGKAKAKPKAKKKAKRKSAY